MEHNPQSTIKTLCLALMALTATVAVSAESPAPQPPVRPPCILFLSGQVEQKPFGNPNPYSLRSFLPDSRLQAKLKEWGYTWTADYFSTGLSWENLTNFNAVVMLDFPNIERNLPAKDEIRRVEALLLRYVEAGGGLFLTGSAESSQWAMERNTEELNRFLKPWGASVLLEQVDERDPTRRLPKPDRNGVSDLAWTDHVAKHPLTEGVAGLLYPVDYGAMCYYTHPIAADATWEVLLRGSKTARSVTPPLGAGDTSDLRPGSIAAEPPLLAVRAAGRGRVVLWPTIPSATIIDGYHPFWGSGLTMVSRDKAHPSDGEQLLANLFAWLVEPSRETMGGYVAPPAKAERELGLYRIEWDKLNPSGPRYPGVYKGLIGLRSLHSTGRDGAAEMLDAARAAGYDFAAFGDELSELTPEEFEQLKAVCVSRCDSNFQAFVGFTYKDGSGNTWQTFGNMLHWPRDDWWHDRAAGSLANNNVVSRGYQFPPVLLVHPNKNPEPAWFQGNFKGLAVYTYEGGACIDDAQEVYTRLQADDYALWPAVVHIVRSVAEVRAAAAAGLPQSLTQWHARDEVLSAYTGLNPKHRGNYVNPWPQFVGNGPCIEAFTVHNFGTSDLAIPDNDRFRMHLRLASEIGLREVRILDGAKVWRRMLPTKTNLWETVLDGFHDRNHHFIVEAVDLNGGKTLTAAIGTSVQELNVPRCTDNFNTFYAGKYKARNLFPIRGLENYFNHVPGELAFFPNVVGVAETERYAVDQRLTRVSRFGYVKTDTLNDFYPLTATRNWNMNDIAEMARPQTALKGEVVTTLFTPWADGTSVYLVEGSFEALRAMEPERGIVRILGFHWVAEADGLVVCRTNGMRETTLLRARRPSWSGDTADIEYVANIGAFEGARALAPLDTRMQVTALRGAATPPTGVLFGDLPLADGKRIEAGERLKYRYLAVWSRMNDPADNRFIEDLLDTMGFRGAPAYRVEPTVGEVLATKFALRLQARSGGFAGTVTEAKLPMLLPVWIEGLNARWPAGIWYKGKHDFMEPTWTMDQVHNRYSRRNKIAYTDRLVRFGVLDGIGMLQLDTEIGDKQVFIGNLLVCDNPDVFLELEDWRKGRERIVINNPTDAEVTVTVRPGPGFDLMGRFEIPITIPAGGMVERELVP